MADIKIGVVEDELLIAHGIIQMLKRLGYDTAGPAKSYDEALAMVETHQPDILLLDIQLKGEKDGIDVAAKVKELYNTPFIFLTANSDAMTLDRVKEVNPAAFLMKPFREREIYAAIEICLHNANTGTTATEEPDQPQENFLINDSLFVKDGQKYVKIKTESICYLESDKKYVYIHTTGKKVMIRSTIQDCIDLIGSADIVRVHRSYAINIQHLETIETEMLIVNQAEVPIGKTYKDELLKRLRIG